jgi:hypothetical protein
MKIGTLCSAILGLLFISGLSLSQEPASPEPVSEDPLLVEASSTEPLPEEPASRSPSPAKPLPARRSSRARSSSDEMVTQIFMLKYFPVEDLEGLITDIFSIDHEKVHADSGSNRLIVQATNGQMDNIKALIEKLDVESEFEGSQVPENLVYRVYMFEIASKDQDLKPFSMILQTPAQLSSTDLLDIAMTQKIQVSDFLIIDERDSENDILIQGKAPSNESVNEMVKLIPESPRIKELKWDDDETFTSSIGAAHYSRLPAQMQKHLKKFLGEDIITVGYWFGSSSVPGEIEAPIGPWVLRLELNPESDRTLELRVEVEVPEERSHFDRQLGRERSDEILSNTIQARIGKPIIVGYNRPSYGTRRMGAMVILPETDQLNTSEPTAP